MARRFSGRRLREHRERAGLRREHLAVAINRSARMVDAYEAGDGVPPTPVVAALADTFGVAVDDLFEEDVLPVAA